MDSGEKGDGTFAKGKIKSCCREGWEGRKGVIKRIKMSYVPLPTALEEMFIMDANLH